MHFAFFTVILAIILSSSAAIPPPPAKPFPSLTQLCLNYIKREKAKGILYLSNILQKTIPIELSETEPTLDQMIQKLKKLAAITYRSSKILRFSLEETTLDYRLPLDLNIPKIMPHSKALLSLIETTPAFAHYLDQLAQCIKNRVLASPTQDPYGFFTVLLCTIPSQLQSIIRKKLHQILAWRVISLPPKRVLVADYQPRSIRKLIQTKDYLIVDHREGVEYMPVKSTLPSRSFTIPNGFQFSYGRSTKGELFCYALGNPMRAAVVNPLQSDNPKTFAAASPIQCVAFSDPPTLMAIAQENGTVAVCDTQSFASYAQLDKNVFSKSPIAKMTFVGKHTILMGHANGELQIWKNNPWHYHSCFSSENHAKIKQLEVTDDGKNAFMHQQKSNCISWINLHEEVWNPYELEHADMECFALAPQKSTVTTAGSQSPFIRIWDYHTLECLHTVTSIPSDISLSTIAFSPSGSQIIFGTRTGMVYKWTSTDPLNQQLFAAHLERKIISGQTSFVAQLCQSSDFKQMHQQQKARIKSLIKRKAAEEKEIKVQNHLRLKISY